MAREKSSQLQVFNAGICEKIGALGAATDFNIVADQTIFQAHKTLFGACSNYLFELFLKTPSTTPVMYILENVQSQDVQNLLIFVYEGKIQVESSQVAGLLNAANQLKIDSLIKKLKNSGQKMANEGIAIGETISEISNYSQKQSILNETSSDVAPPLSKSQLSGVIVEDLQQNAIQPQLLDELPNEEISNASSSAAIFAFAAPHAISYPVRNSSQVLSSSQQNQSIIITPSNDTDNDKHTPIATTTNIVTTVAVKRGRCKQPRIPTPYPASSNPPQLKIVGEKQKDLLPTEHAVSQQSQVSKKSSNQIKHRFGNPLLCSTIVGQEIPAISDERLQKVERDLVGVLIETNVDEGPGIRQIPDIDRSSDDSSYLDLTLRKKLPMAKRRRIPASTRPEILSSTFSPDETPPRPQRLAKRRTKLE